MNIDVHAHFVPAQSLKMAGEIGTRHGLKLETQHGGFLPYTWGSDYPYDVGEPEPVAALRAARLRNGQFEQIAGGNACKLLKIGI